jgi:hypothetical protein
VKRELSFFLLKVILITLILGFLWFWKLQELYPHILSPIAVPLFQWFGVKKWLLTRVMDHFTSIVPYVALVLATPDAIRNWKKTTLSLLGGIIILAISHLFLSWAVYHYSEQYRFSKSYFRATFPIFLICDALPLLLWLTFYPRLLPEFFGFMKRTDT